MNFIENKIFSFCRQAVLDAGFLLIDVSFRGDNRNKIIEVFIDSAGVITIDDCSLISKAILESLDADTEIDIPYRLDVSSPGVDRPLKFIEQYPKHLGRQFEIVYVSQADNEVKLKAKLSKVEGEDIVFTKGKDEIKINFNNVKNAKVLISFDDGGKNK